MSCECSDVPRFGVVSEAIIDKEKYRYGGLALIDDRPEVDMSNGRATWCHIVFDHPYNKHSGAALRIRGWDNPHLEDTLEAALTRPGSRPHHATAVQLIASSHGRHANRHCNGRRLWHQNVHLLPHPIDEATARNVAHRQCTLRITNSMAGMGYLAMEQSSASVNVGFRFADYSQTALSDPLARRINVPHCAIDGTEHVADGVVVLVLNTVGGVADVGEAMPPPVGELWPTTIMTTATAA